VRIPEALAAEWAHDPAWLERLPDLVADLADLWSLELEQPIATPHSLVVPAGEVVLKINNPSHFEAEHEADALQAWHGEGAVRLLARDEERRGLLLERCRPGTRLWDSTADEVPIAAELLQRLSTPLESPHPFRPLSGEARRWTTAVPERYAIAGRPFEQELLDEALAVFRDVDDGALTLVNQDLHGANILRSDRSPWLVIDPKPLVGEPELSAVGLLRNALFRGQSLERWLDALRELGFDRDRMRGWGLAHTLAWAWDDRRGWSGDLVAAARAIAAAG
jgi:streptomycin 6-kinase